MMPNEFLTNAQHTLKLKSQAELARFLGRSPQALSASKKYGYSIERIAIQLERLTDGKIKAIDLQK